jgi:hypothetical protein
MGFSDASYKVARGQSVNNRVDSSPADCELFTSSTNLLRHSEALLVMVNVVVEGAPITTEKVVSNRQLSGVDIRKPGT